jgi:hypothetical protein
MNPRTISSGFDSSDALFDRTNAAILAKLGIRAPLVQ